MSKFKTGDRLRVLRTDFTADIKVGAILTGVNPGPKGIHLATDKYPEGLYFYDYEVELAEPAKVTFKKGDKVRCRVDYDPGRQFTKGAIYTVTQVYNYGGLQMNDDRGLSNGWGEDNFELVTEEPLKVTSSPGPFIVIVKDRIGRLKPGSVPATHTTREAAETEARRLADRSPGEEFVVFQAVSLTSAPATPVPPATTKSL